jgi:hypothetical protein
VGAVLRVRHASRVLADVQLDAGLGLERRPGVLSFGRAPAPGAISVPRPPYVFARGVLVLPLP